MTYSRRAQKAHRKLWVEALRSGKYRQAKGYLHEGDGSMCCLGVACDISGLGKWSKDGTVFSYVLHEAHDARMLPQEVGNWLGLRGKMGGFTDEAGTLKLLSDLNDSGVPFEKIADIIEREPLNFLSSTDNGTVVLDK